LELAIAELIAYEIVPSIPTNLSWMLDTLVSKVPTLLDKSIGAFCQAIPVELLIGIIPTDASAYPFNSKLLFTALNLNSALSILISADNPPASTIVAATAVAPTAAHFPSEFKTKKSPVWAPEVITSANSLKLVIPAPPTLELIRRSPKYKLPFDESFASYIKYKVFSSLVTKLL